MKKWAPLIWIMLLLLVEMVGHQYLISSYSQSSVEQHKLCLDQLNSVEICGYVNSVAGSAYSTAMSGEQTSFFILFNGLLILGFWIFSLEKRLDKLQDKTDV